MKKYISSLLVLVSGFAFSQTILNASSPEEFRKMRDESMRKVGDTLISNKVKPLEYGFVDDKDILKSMFVWEVIDMNDKLNQPFYYDNPDGLLSTPTRSLYQLLLDGALSGNIKEVYDDENLTIKLSPEGIQKRLEAVVVDDAAIDILNSGRQLTEQEKKEYTDHIKTTTDKVKVLKIMGMWFIDKRDGQMKYRPLAISAMGPDPSIQGKVGPDGMPLAGADELIDLFWIYYPSAREILANNYVYNRKNSSADLSFDDIINARRFSSIIYKSSSGLGDGVIKDYIPKNADEQLEESDRIKAQILEMENSMWNY
ncbi:MULTISPECIES: type IX secretion system ring protein PorN/GldN [Chryseobacterium]|uniref:Gliding motility associated protein GldN n=1 Tax=Chryseobacterium camelliae TaxID=1265445 RepID=A0ABU0TDN5_9FLAO|nr:MULTISPECIES: gliding motility protein GldN [Chryseobacterium]MDT3407148.1 gliding motility associated protein GldN [Pseudacidovorax intermedius]MDQ1095061.1 gliding motility associated protein GldN [Chryseobacterium camelliae]MDQ1099000.1 gliding motility associated protein GldN [Chryseobacterium sp. SORGH_AS_1048]MDR6086348.1 gliding motility associated protein GldN [Chryseobacterium sp. SORGH_AS_0909]MDR6130720.1 gliding motility associated protein GldN [Chryseobacterium sp. SORGH_AS_117